MKNCGSTGLMSMDSDKTALVLFGPSNRPHVIATYSPNDGRISGIEGSASSRPKAEYHEYILDLEEHLGVPIKDNTIKNYDLQLKSLFKDFAEVNISKLDIEDPWSEYYLVETENNNFYSRGTWVISEPDFIKAKNFLSRNPEFIKSTDTLKNEVNRSVWNKLERSPESVAPEEILKAIFVGNRLDMDRLSKMADINYISMYLSDFKDTVKSARFNKIKMLYKIARNTIVFDLDTGEVFDKNIKSWRWPTDGELADVFFGEELSDVGDLNPDTISYKKDEDGNDGRLDLRDEDGKPLATLRVDEPPEYEISWHNLSRKHVDSRPKNMTLPDGNSVTIKEIKLASEKVIKELIKLANKLDEQELYEEADKLDKIIEDSAKEYGSELNMPILGEDGEGKYQANSTGSNAKSAVLGAIERSMDMPHFKNTFLMRNPGANSEGSTFDEPQTPETLMAAEWREFYHPEIQTPAKGYFAPIPGSMKLIKLDTLDPKTPIRMELDKNGYITAALSPADVGRGGVPVHHTVMLLGPSDDGPIVLTFHPGDPVRPSTTAPSAETRAAKTVEEAMCLGFQYGKIAGSI